MKKISILSLFTLIFLTANAQKDCKDNISYTTVDIGNGMESLPYSLKFIIARDTIWMGNNEISAKTTETTYLLIKSKSCNWNASYTEGVSIYEVISEGKKTGKAIFKIIQNKEIKRIEIIYENSEPRIFNML